MEYEVELFEVNGEKYTAPEVLMNGNGQYYIGRRMYDEEMEMILPAGDRLSDYFAERQNAEDVLSLFTIQTPEELCVLGAMVTFRLSEEDAKYYVYHYKKEQ